MFFFFIFYRNVKLTIAMTIKKKNFKIIRFVWEFFFKNGEFYIETESYGTELNKIEKQSFRQKSDFIGTLLRLGKR